MCGILAVLGCSDDSQAKRVRVLELSRRSGLRISLEKSTLYLAGVSNQSRDQITNSFPFATGQLPVRYLGLPLLTKRMTAADYAPLLERIRSMINSWTVRALSYAGRLALINSVIVSISNFWMSAYRLPAGCLKEIEKMCSAFLWSGPELNTKKAKIAWKKICKPKQEGGLGIKSLLEANKVSCLKLIWRIISMQPSMWVTWIWKYLIRKGSFWSVKESSSTGSWMWKKLLKYRGMAKIMHKVEVRNGKSTSFWYDTWSHMGRLIDLTGTRGVIDMGIPLDATVGDVLQPRRTRRHRLHVLNEIETEILTTRQQAGGVVGNDIPQWKVSGNKFSKHFTTKHTWNNIRSSDQKVEWYKGVWFSFSTPKYSFLLWLAVHNRLTTGDRIKSWNSGQRTNCVLCEGVEETRDHLFFSCSYSAAIWKNLAQILLRAEYSTDWNKLLEVLNNKTTPRLHLFLIRYVFQATIYHIWRERNARRHGELQSPQLRLIKLIDKNVRNRLSSIKAAGYHRYDDSLKLWFSTRSTQQTSS